MHVYMHCGESHLYFLIDLLKHPGDDILPFHRLDLISSWPDILQKHLLALCIHSWGRHVTDEKISNTHCHYYKATSVLCKHAPVKTESLPL